MTVAREIRRQLDLLRRQGRDAFEVRVGPDAYTGVACSTAFLVNPWIEHADARFVGWVAGLMVLRDARPGVFVRPTDFQGFGQGACRPGNAA